MEPAREVWTDADLRAGDADRKRVVAELQRHFVDGRLTSEELSDRITAALQARTFGELRALLTDLPALSDHSELAPTARGDWKTQLLSPPLGGALILVGVLALLWLLVATTGGHGGFFPFWPVLFFFFFFGRPSRGGRRRF